MRVVVQRVAEASVRVIPGLDHPANDPAGEVVARIGPGLVSLVGVASDDGDAEVQWMADKLVGLRVFEDEVGRMNRSIADTGGELLVVSQFTLLADCRRGKRPSFVDAAPPDLAEPLYERLVEALRVRGARVQTGRFRTDMRLALVNSGPVTIVIDTPRREAAREGV